MRVAWLFVLCLFLAGCVSAPKEMPAQKIDIFDTAKKVLKKDYLVVVIPRENVESGNLSDVVDTLVPLFAEGEKVSRGLAIASRSGGVTAKVIEDALDRNFGKRLSYLRILYFGEKQYNEELQKKVHEFGAKYYFRELHPSEEK